MLRFFMGDLQELLERTTINFPRSVEEKEAWALLEYVAINVGNNCRIWGGFSGFFRVSEGQTEERYFAKIEGMLSKEDGHVVACFSFLRDEKDLEGSFFGLKFDTIPGYDLDELPREEVRLYDSVRDILNKYFNQFQ